MGFFTADIEQRLVNGAKTFDIANAVGCTVADVARTARSAGYQIQPNGTLSKKGATGTPLERAHTPPARLRHIPTAGGPTRDDRTGDTRAMTTATTARPAPTPPPAELPKARAGLGSALLAVSELTSHRDARVCRQAERTLVQLRKLSDVVTDFDEKAATRDEVERLERQLREARQRLHGGRGGTATRAPADINWKAVRAWAAENDVPCSQHGRIAQTVVDAYLEAQAS